MTRLAIALLLASCSSAALAEPSFSIDNATARENSGTIDFLVRKHGTLNNLPSKVLVYAVPGTAKGGGDYVEDAFLLTFGVTESQKLVTFLLTNDDVPELSEAFTARLLRGSNARLYDKTAVGTITDEDTVAPPPPQTCPDGSVILATAVCPPPPPPPPPTQTCPDGSVIPATSTCPPPPPPVPSWVVSPTPEGVPIIPSTFDITTGLQKAWSTGAIPKSAAPDLVGAFRFICGAAGVSRDDPVLFPNQPGASSLVQYFCSNEIDAFSTYEVLRRKNKATAGLSPVNPSSYGMPAMLDGKGNAVQPNYVSIYYKRRPASDPMCNLAINPAADGDCVPTPRGLRFTFGYDATGINSAKTGAAYFNCAGPTAKPAHYETLDLALANCPKGQGNEVGAIISSPQCWDGKHLDSPDHRSHVSYRVKDRSTCPATHPKVIATFTQGAWYSVEAGDSPELWRFASDPAGAKPGSTFSSHWFGAWDSGVQAMWIDNCINKLLNCSGGDLGNGLQVVGGQRPAYGWKNPNRLVPIP